jgi:hypothetical protein
MVALAPASQAIRIFVSYAHEDCAARDELRMTLRDLERDGVIALWTDHALNAGDAWDDEIRANLDAAQVIVLLVSRAFIASDYIDRVELRRAKERHQAGSARLIPIIVSACDWQAKFGSIEAIPSGTPVANYPDVKNPDKELAWNAVRQGLKAVIGKITQGAPPTATTERSGLTLVGEGVPKSCDRSDQISQFCTFYSDMRERRPGVPHLYVLVEEDLDRPDFLVDRIRSTQVPKLAASLHGDRRASCPQFHCDVCNDRSLKGLQGSLERNLSALLDDKSFELDSHVVVRQHVDGNAAAPNAAKLVSWLAAQIASRLNSTQGPQWMFFLIMEFGSYGTDSTSLRRNTFEEVSALFGKAGDGLRMMNHGPKGKGAPTLLLPPPETLTAGDIYQVLRMFPFPLREAGRLSEKIHADLVRVNGAARIEDIYNVIEDIRKRFAKTGELTYVPSQSC